MNDRNIPVYLSPSDISVLRAAVEMYVRGQQDYDLEKQAYGLSERFRMALDEYRDEVKQSKGRRVRPR